MCFHFLPPLLYFPSSSKEDGGTQVQSMLINLPHLYTPPHVHTKRKNLAWFLSLLSSMLTATLCALGFTEDLPVNPTCDRTEETPYVSKESYFFFSGLVINNGTWGSCWSWDSNPGLADSRTHAQTIVCCIISNAQKYIRCLYGGLVVKSCPTLATPWTVGC